MIRETTIVGDWKTPAVRALIAHRQQAAPWAWSYGLGLKACVEPTALAVLGLVAATEGSRSAEVSVVVRLAGDWLASLQQSNGSLGISEASPEPGWTTPFALLAWNVLGDTKKSASSRLPGCCANRARSSPKRKANDQCMATIPRSSAGPG